MQDETIWGKGKMRIYVLDLRYDEEIGRRIVEIGWEGGASLWRAMKDNGGFQI